MKSNKIIKQENIKTTYQSIKKVLEEARNTAYRSVNFAMVQAYWHIGRIIVEEEQKGEERAEYGKYLIKELSVRLTNEYGKGFNITNLKYIRQFFMSFPNGHALRDELSWTHYRLLLKVEKETARNFYMIEAINNKWSTRELERQISSLLYERIAQHKKDTEIQHLARKGLEVQEPKDLIKDPYVLEFLDVKKNTKFLEKDLEQQLIDKLQQFLLETII